VLGIGCWVLGIGYWVLGIGCWVLGIELLMFLGTCRRAEDRGWKVQSTKYQYNACCYFKDDDVQ
jgi:hypothetical protein